MKKYKRKGFLPYLDTRGLPGSGSYRMPRKLKKWWRLQIEANIRKQYQGIVKVKLWWQPLVGWTMKVTGYPGRNKYRLKVGKQC